ncbi:MAG TPA: hypothetical protein VJN18_18930 [Polyangiaceae bacterium]|nr:hypothetical protein [Polyangiaceae bacterium]
MTQSLQERARKARERAQIQAWQYRQRNLASGVWFRVRRVLVDAAEAFRISAEDAERLERAGARPAPAGLELEPAKRLFFVDREELASLPSRCSIPVRLGAAFLAARDVVLVRHSKG